MTGLGSSAVGRRAVATALTVFLVGIGLTAWAGPSAIADPSADASADVTAAAVPIASDYDFTDFTSAFDPSSINNNQDVLINRIQFAASGARAAVWNNGVAQTVIPITDHNNLNKLYDISDSGFITGTIDKLRPDVGLYIDYQAKRFTTTDFLGKDLGSSADAANNSWGSWVNNLGDALTIGTKPATNGDPASTAFEFETGSTTPVEVGTGLGALATGSDYTVACGLSDSRQILADIGRSSASGVSGTYLLSSPGAAGVKLDFQAGCTNNPIPLSHLMSQNGTIVGSRTSDGVPVIRTTAPRRRSATRRSPRRR